ncbi:MAG TPA: hypothetical protein VLT37_03780 [Acidocella sp.]|nr:hypothetical protein [Acidocella sp.]
MSGISSRAQDKLRALLVCNQDGTGTSSLVYADACATWFAGLMEEERRIADQAITAHSGGDKARAELLAGKLPRAPKPVT